MPLLRSQLSWSSRRYPLLQPSNTRLPSHGPYYLQDHASLPHCLLLLVCEGARTACASPVCRDRLASDAATTDRLNREFHIGRSPLLRLYRPAHPPLHPRLLQTVTCRRLSDAPLQPYIYSTVHAPPERDTSRTCDTTSSTAMVPANLLLCKFLHSVTHLLYNRPEWRASSEGFMAPCGQQRMHSTCTEPGLQKSSILVSSTRIPYVLSTTL